MGEDQASLPLKSLVARLLICDAVKDKGEIAATSVAIGQWVSGHEPGVKTAGGSEKTSASIAGEKPESVAGKRAAKDDKPTPKVLPDELLLGMAALRMPKDAIDEAQVVKMLQRAIAVAEANREEALAGSLRCQIAKRIADHDPDRARAILMKALDSVLPRSDEKAEAQAKEGQKS